jgi:hypothetical protein
MIPFATPFMTPRVHDQKDKNHKTKDQQDDRTRSIIPELLNTPGDVFEIHSGLTYTSAAKSEIVTNASLDRPLALIT